MELTIGDPGVSIGGGEKEAWVCLFPLRNTVL